MKPTPKDAVTLWFVQLKSLTDTERTHLLAGLAEDERTRHGAFLVVRKGDVFLQARHSLRRILASCLGCTAEEVVLELEGDGKPVLTGKFAGELNFNVSHSEGGALFAVCGSRRIGVDLEHVRPKPNWRALSQRFFSERERAQLESVSAASPGLVDREFFRIWTLKESLVKASGDGLSLVFKDSENGFPGWWRSSLDGVPEAYCAALALEGVAPPAQLEWRSL